MSDVSVPGVSADHEADDDNMVLQLLALKFLLVSTSFGNILGNSGMFIASRDAGKEGIFRCPCIKLSRVYTSIIPCDVLVCKEKERANAERGNWALSDFLT
jgi:hypothetical protein